VKPVAPAYKNKETDVAKLAAGITGQDSLLMRQARTEGLKTANRRGLLSSSIAAGAAQGAVVGKAAEMAQATAGFNAAENVATADRLSTEKIAADNRTLEQKLTTMRISSEEKQQLKQIASTQGIAAAERRLALMTQGRAIAADSKEKKLDRGLQTELAKWNLDSSDREKAAGMLTTYASLYEQQLASINSNKDLNAGQRTAQITALNARRASYTAAVKSLYDVDISFGAKPAAKPGAKPTGPTKPGTPPPPKKGGNGLPANPKNGTVAKNTQTGKNMVFINGQWAIIT
jgi:hypothetical protein